MRKIPFNTETDGTSRTIKAQYYKNGFVNFFIEGDYGATGVLEMEDDYRRKVIIPINTTEGGCHKTIYSRMGRLSWENYLGRLEHGGWDCQMTSILEIYEVED